ncbi:MAG TPA: DUF4126 domain-containing protein [Candidatus Eremiobacteraceae bacterium]|nr:DUF4126 domain-containing protein [Candidatus Eremiobacteraceae bacterium]
MTFDATAQYALAYALTTTAGLRGFLTLLVASIAVHLGWIHPSATFAWLGSDVATIILAVFAFLEILADKFPGVDHAMQAVYFVARPVAAAILVGATVHPSNTAELYAMMAAGGINALIVHGSASTTRVASTVSTAGLGNTALSFIEDALTGGGLFLAFFQPILAAVIALAFVIVLVFVARGTVARVRALAPRRDR